MKFCDLKDHTEFNTRDSKNRTMLQNKSLTSVKDSIHNMIQNNLLLIKLGINKQNHIWQYVYAYNTDMQRNNNLFSTEAKKYSSTSAATVVTISFASEKDRIKGVATLIRSPYPFNGINKNEFIIEKEYLKIFENTEIKYNIIK